MTFLIRTVVKYLRDTANQIEKGDCNITDEQAMEIDFTRNVVANLVSESFSRYKK